MLKFCLRLQLIFIFIATSFFIVQKAHADPSTLTITGIEVQKITQNNLGAVSSIQTQPEDFVTISLFPVADFNFRNLYQNFPWGLLTLGAVPFDIPENNNGATSGHGVVETVILSTNPIKVKTVYLFLNSWDTWLPYDHLKLGEVSINFEDSTSQKTDLVIGENIREWRHGNDIYPTVNTVTSPDSTEVFTGNPSSLAGPAVLDMLKIEIDQSNLDKNVTSISVTDSLIEVIPNTPTDPNLFLAGLTLEKVTQQSLPVPYFSQKDPQWGSNEYDHGNTQDLWCGTTMSQCGCAVTSAAMILKYYGVDRNPDGLPTSPKTLNDWLKANNGYTFGNVRWPSIGAYSLRVNEIFGTQKIKFVNFGLGNDFATLNNELNNERPVILQENFLNNTHYIVATGKAGSTYSINDPADPAKQKLSSYADSFNGMRLYERTSTDLSTIYITSLQATDIFLVDSIGRRVGKDPNTGIIYNEISNSFYLIEPNLTDDTISTQAANSSSSGITTLAIINPQQGSYKISSSSPEDNHEISFAGYDKDGNISTFDYNGLSDEFNLNFSPTLGSEISVEQIVDIDVKPLSRKNIIYSTSHGVLPVAIINNSNFDSKNIDIRSIKLGNGQASPLFGKGFLIDFDRDGDKDLIAFFKTKEVNIQAQDNQLCLTGQTQLGANIKGCDNIQVYTRRLTNDKEDLKDNLNLLNDRDVIKYFNQED